MKVEVLKNNDIYHLFDDSKLVLDLVTSSRNLLEQESITECQFHEGFDYNKKYEFLVEAFRLVNLPLSRKIQKELDIYKLDRSAQYLLNDYYSAQIVEFSWQKYLVADKFPVKKSIPLESSENLIEIFCLHSTPDFKEIDYLVDNFKGIYNRKKLLEFSAESRHPANFSYFLKNYDWSLEELIFGLEATLAYREFNMFKEIIMKCPNSPKFQEACDSLIMPSSDFQTLLALKLGYINSVA